MRTAAALAYGIAMVEVVQHWTTGKWLVLDVGAIPFFGDGTHWPEIAGAYGEYIRSLH